MDGAVSDIPPANQTLLPCLMVWDELLGNSCWELQWREPHAWLFAPSGGGRSDKSCLPKVSSLLEKSQWLPSALELQARRGKQVQLHKIKPFLQLSIPSSSWHFSAEQHRNNSTAQSSSLITPINHRDDKTKPGRISHGNVFRRGQHLQLPWRRANPCGLLGSANIPRAFPEHWDLLALVYSSCQGLTTAGALCSSVQTETPSMCAASALAGREVKLSNPGIQPFLSWNGMGEAEGSRKVCFGGVTIFLSLQAH